MQLDITWLQNMEALAWHGALEFMYNGSLTPLLFKTLNDIIAATFFIVNTINAVLSFVTDGSISTENFIEHREKAEHLIGTLYSTL